MNSDSPNRVSSGCPLGTSWPPNQANLVLGSGQIVNISEPDPPIYHPFNIFIAGEVLSQAAMKCNKDHIVRL